MFIFLLLVTVGLYLDNKDSRKDINKPVSTVNLLPSAPAAPALFTDRSVSLPAPPAYKDEKNTLVGLSVQKAHRDSVLSLKLESALKDTGERLLREQEKGEGPNITIFWPNSMPDRDWIKQRLYGCGVRLALFNGDRLTAIEKGRYALSGFMRPLGGNASTIEQSRINRLQGRGQVVRVFPRYLDERMLVSFDVLAAKRFKNVKSISARYIRKNSSLYITSIVVDGATFQKEQKILPDSGCGKISD